LHPSLDILVSGDSLGPHQDNRIPQFGGDFSAQNHYGVGRPYLPEYDGSGAAPRPPQGGFTIDRRKYQSSDSHDSSFESESWG